MFSVGERSFCWCGLWPFLTFKIFYMHKNVERKDRKNNRSPLTNHMAPRVTFWLFSWIISLPVCLSEEVEFSQLSLGVTLSVRRGCQNVGSCFQCDYLHVTFGIHIPGGSCIIKTASLTIPGLSSKLGMTACHSVYTNVWLSSLINNGWCLAVNPQPPLTLAFEHRENVSLPHPLPSCLSFLNRW